MQGEIFCGEGVSVDKTRVVGKPLQDSTLAPSQRPNSLYHKCPPPEKTLPCLGSSSISAEISKCDFASLGCVQLACLEESFAL